MREGRKSEKEETKGKEKKEGERRRVWGAREVKVYVWKEGGKGEKEERRRKSMG